MPKWNTACSAWAPGVAAVRRLGAHGAGGEPPPVARQCFGVGSVNRKKNFSHRVIVRAPSLLPMLYTPRELQRELGVPADTWRDWTRQGMPSQKDEHGRIWIHGVALRHWIAQMHRAQTRVRMERDEAYCFHCRKPVKLSTSLARRVVQGKLALTQGRCPTCGGIVSRGGRVD
jgi:hypothetical protein